MTAAPLVAALQAIAGKRFVLTDTGRTHRFRTGIRFGNGSALAVVQPGSLVELWRVLQACVEAGVVVIPQAANTGLTGGSTPDGDDYDRDIVIVSTSRMRRIHVIDGGKQVICLPGATLDELERLLLPLGREPHSVIGSSCIGASVIGGICNNSGGSLVRRGPAYTEMSMFAHVDDGGRLRLVNHLGVRLDGSTEEALARLERGGFSDADVLHDAARGHDHRYAQHVRQVDEPTPARFNADAHRLFESSGSAGKVMVFAVRVDTFPIEQGARVFYIGTNRTEELDAIRRQALTRFAHLPIAGEYLHRDAFAIADKYGKDSFWLIRKAGTARLPGIFAFKARCDAALARVPWLPGNLVDRLLQAASRLLPDHLPPRLRAFHARFDHHLLLKVTAEGADEARDFLTSHLRDAEGEFFECTPDEGARAFLHRFVVAGAANRYRAVNPRTVQDILALDIALPRNERRWFETLPAAIERRLVGKLYYGHFLCHVFHQDYFVAKGHDSLAIEHEMWRLLDARGAEYPAEHNVGHLYDAKPALRAHYKRLDPCNCLNPGVGRMSKLQGYREPAA